MFGDRSNFGSRQSKNSLGAEGRGGMKTVKLQKIRRIEKPSLNTAETYQN